MNDTEQYILDSIRTWVWSGFYTPEEVDERITDILEDDADEAMLRAAVAPEYARKEKAEASWPARTDCDRLDDAFESLNASGVIALHNAGYTMSDGLAEVSEELHQRGRHGVKGYCFYHEQDVERAVSGEGLNIAFGALNDDAGAKAEAGGLVRDELKLQGIHVEWNGDPEERLLLPAFDWKRRAD